MTAVLYDDVVTVPPAPSLTLAPPPKQASKRRRRDPIAPPSDPAVDAAARLLAIPLRHMYAVLWRVGVLEVTA
ncbi:hypothetical protein H7H78_18580 [Mycobacterium shinjukuense]|uniref:Uncharacterized protein n=1 Tax=Mycobacterium shinjukuense TaxID=398694 RepID=A0A7I7MSH9_9MYCO|nr:Rv1535 family protein [Mycobacterium shinjukuense]MCV6987338.1 hypothetical protein [Mycobacterium shinjukuense]ORB72004.1 hypothetical protein BST45_01025 [Mycobacterium shinjukuense]BBX74757.1 hypothetical protein MSHI_26630 [Mycobacterium shinjukuense]